PALALEVLAVRATAVSAGVRHGELLLAARTLRQHPRRHAAAAGVTGALYLFQQNWLHTIVFGQYWGMTYVVYLVTVAAFLSDVVFNRARFTTRILNALLKSAGSSLQAVPC